MTDDDSTTCNVRIDFGKMVEIDLEGKEQDKQVHRADLKTGTVDLHPPRKVSFRCSCLYEPFMDTLKNFEMHTI